jgi:hypothetical protein
MRATSRQGNVGKPRFIIPVLLLGNTLHFQQSSGALTLQLIDPRNSCVIRLAIIMPPAGSFAGCVN